MRGGNEAATRTESGSLPRIPASWQALRMRDSRYDVLFEPVRLGPVTARNRFFQVPHCNGMGWREPRAHAAMRGVKAEGGWAVVCTEEVEIHPSTDVTPYIEGRLWDDSDIAAHALLTEAVHAHGSLAGIELVHSGLSAANLSSRLAPLGPGHLPVKGTSPVQARRATLAELAELRRWHRAAVARSLRAGYDVVYVYAGHSLSIAQHFLSPPHEPPRRRLRRRPARPGPAAAGAARGRARGGRRARRGGLPAGGRRAARRAAASSGPRPRSCSAWSASCPTCGTSWSAPGRRTPRPPASAARPSRSPTSAA